MHFLTLFLSFFKTQADNGSQVKVLSRSDRRNASVKSYDSDTKRRTSVLAIGVAGMSQLYSLFSQILSILLPYSQ